MLGRHAPTAMPRGSRDAPIAMDSHEHFVQLGTRHVWGGNADFGLGRSDRRAHIYMIGKSGSGKSTLLRNLIVQDIEAGEGVAVIDPHGDLANELLDSIPARRTDDVVYFDPADTDYPIGLNLLASVPSDDRHLVVSGIVGAFKSIWGDSWGPRLEYILANAISALLECQNVSLLALPRLLTDERYRDWILRQVSDPLVLRFWRDEFERWDARFRNEAIAPIQNKVGQLLMATPMRNILGQVKSKIDARFIMDHRRIFIANLSKGRLGADKTALLGALLVTQFQLAAMGRSVMRESDRVDFGLFIDEYHNFTTDSFASILSEARKYRLCLTLVGQYIAQASTELRDAVFGNVGTIVSFRVGESDAEVLAREFGNDFIPEQFSGLGNYEVCVKMLNQGTQEVPFLGRTLPPMSEQHNRRENLIHRSRERYATPRAVVEEKIRRWFDKRW